MRHRATTAFIRAQLRLAPAPPCDEIRLYQAHSGSALGRLAEGAAEGSAEAAPPYWAFPWAGGLALARYVLDHPETAAGKRVLDLGAGSGLVAIAAARAGANAVAAVDADPAAIAAIALNAAANGVEIAARRADLLSDPPPAGVDVILVGDLFYEADLAARVIPYLERCAAAGLAVLIGDPDRAALPRDRLQPLARYAIRDVGSAKPGAAGVYALAAPPSAGP